MKGGADWFYTSLIFLAGCFITYMFCQVRYLEVDAKINVLELITNVSTIIIGLYLGININNNLSKKQHLISFIEPKLELVLTIASDIRGLLEPNTSIDAVTVSKKIKSINAAVAQILKIFNAFKKNDGCITAIDEAIDSLEDRINLCPVSLDIIDYSASKTDIINLIDELDLRIVKAINYVHNK